MVVGSQVNHHIPIPISIPPPPTSPPLHHPTPSHLHPTQLHTPPTPPPLQARILYSNCEGRAAIAAAFNDAIASGKLSAPVVLSRDHHDVSGTDSPFRETSNIYDGSAFTADMAVQNALGDAARGATWVALHNGGGVGWGEVINGGFGLVLDGSAEARRRSDCMLSWDVSNGLARRAWAGNANAELTVRYRSHPSSLPKPNLNTHVCIPNPPFLSSPMLAWRTTFPAKATSTLTFTPAPHYPSHSTSPHSTPTPQRRDGSADRAHRHDAGTCRSRAGP